MPLALSNSVGAVMCACLCAKELALDASSAQVLSTTSNLNNTSVSFCCSVAGHMPGALHTKCDLIQDMKLG